MEQIQLTHIESNETHTYILSVCFNHNMYECTVSDTSFKSEIVAAEHLDVLLYEGLRPGVAKKFDENLQVSAQCVADDATTLRVSLELSFQKGKMKPRVEQHTFVLSKRTVDAQTALANLMQGINLAHVKAHSTNIFVDVCEAHLSVKYRERPGIVCSVHYIVPAFLEMLCAVDADLAGVVSNRLNAQETITTRVQDSLRQHFSSGRIYALVCEYLANTFYINFLQIAHDGQYIHVNVDTTRVPQPRKYDVTNDVPSFRFDPRLNYRILQTFYIPQHTDLSEVVMCRVGQSDEWTLYENGTLMCNWTYAVTDERGQTCLHTDASGVISKIRGDFDCFFRDGMCLRVFNERKIDVLERNIAQNGTFSSKTVRVVLLQRGLQGAKKRLTLIENI